jgi:hypothetical protein
LVHSQGYELEKSGVQFQQSMVIFLFPKMPRAALGLSQPPDKWIKGALPLGLNSQSIQLSIHFHLGLRLRMQRAIPLLPLYALIVWTREFLHLYYR